MAAVESFQTEIPAPLVPCGRTDRHGHHPLVARNPALQLQILAESVFFDLPVVEFALPGGQCADHGLFLGQRSVSALRAPARHVDHDADQSDSGRKRFCRIRI